MSDVLLSNTGAVLDRPTEVSDYLGASPIWRPAIGLFRQLRFKPKAMVIAAAFMAPIVLLAWNDFDRGASSLRATARERDGVAFARILLPAIKHGRQLRRFTLAQAASAPVPGDPQAMREQLSTDIAAVKEADARLGGALGTHDAVAALDAALKAAQPGTAGIMPVFASHGKLNAALLNVLGAVSDGSGLTVDPDLDTYYLVGAALPASTTLLEQTARMRVLSAATAQSGQGAVVAGIELARQDGLIEYVAGELATDLTKVIGVHPEMSTALEFASVLKAVNALRDMASDDLASGGADKAKALDNAGAAIVTRLENLQLESLAKLDRLLSDRANATRRHMIVTSAVILLFGLLAAYLFYAFSLVMGLGLREVRRHLTAVTAGDLSTQPLPRGADETAFLLNVIAEMQASLRSIVGDVRASADNIAQAGAQIAAGADELSERTNKTAAHVEQSASAMEQISSTVKSTADHTSVATTLATDNAHAASRGGEVIGNMINTMDGIQSSSGRIADIIGVIDGIAFQTNILALNAAVEAARAGESGRGFAVVASEVRLLAQRSAGAAREIKSLITESVEKVEAGTGIVRNAGESMNEIVQGSHEVQRLLGQIATGAQEQTMGIDRVGDGIAELDHSTQQNAALVEETAAAASALRELARTLSLKVARFKLPS